MLAVRARTSVRPYFETRRTVAFVIEARGMAPNAKMAAGGGPDPALDRCVLDEVRKIEFAKPDSGTVKVEYPIVFKTGR